MTTLLSVGRYATMTTLLSVGRYVYCETENHNEVFEKVKAELWRHYRTVAMESHGCMISMLKRRLVNRRVLQMRDL